MKTCYQTNLRKLSLALISFKKFKHNKMQVQVLFIRKRFANYCERPEEANFAVVIEFILANRWLYLIAQDQPEDVIRTGGCAALHQHRQEPGQGWDPVHRRAGRNSQTDHRDQEHRRCGTKCREGGGGSEVPVKLRTQGPWVRFSIVLLFKTALLTQWARRVQLPIYDLVPESRILETDTTRVPLILPLAPLCFNQQFIDV